MKFNLKYFIATLILFFTEVAIATVFKEIVWLRSFFGDVLVVILMYTFFRSFYNFNKTKLIIGIFIFACLVEVAQYFHFAEILGFRDNKLMMIVLGNSFSWIDILCYGAGCLLLYFVEVKLFSRSEI